ncbi:Regulator of ribonuclease activity A [Trema orientale]|uniref:4-hydroxy-4-methyl-2-oxoglutarate aldolase n=1 Tax=Trema orientale TaxID=63057 RepID=A0A2P5EL48_TREOI|nr:Regulator of ribonuclease activity A [Trema orientale]
MDVLATTDLCDSNIELMESGELRFLQPVFKTYGKREAFSGRIETLKVLDDNGLVLEALRSRGEGKVLVIDGAGSMRCALMGGQLTQLAERMGWAGVVVNGCIRDVNDINECDIGVRALASHPVRPTKKGLGERHLPAFVAGTLILDGDWLYADADGILVSKSELSVSSDKLLSIFDFL